MKRIIAKYLTNSASATEIKKLEKWIGKDNNEEIFKEYVNINFKMNHLSTFSNISKNKRSLLDKSSSKIRVLPLRRFKSITKYAAITAAVVVLGFIFHYKYDLENQKQNKAATVVKVLEQPILLKKGNGEIQELNIGSITNVVRNSEGSQLAVQQGAHIKYDIETNTTDKLEYNEMIVPKGERFSVTLSDGTRVNLNSGTVLKFPVNFLPGQQRKVYLKGEAFFDVNENKSTAFVVNTGEINIKVLGTRFNVSAYEEDTNINTVLLEGSVQVYDSIITKSNTNLVPGQIASWDKIHKSFSSRFVDVNMHIAWIHGQLILRKMPFKIIRKKLEKYYNISIINNNELLDDQYYNMNFDNETIEQVLEILNENFNIDYVIKDGTVIIN